MGYRTHCYDLCLLGCLVGSSAALGEDLANLDKRQFHLLNPTPRTLLRPMSTDRPDKTETPYTVDAGHFQVEMDVVTYGADRESVGGRTVEAEGWGFFPANLKLGLRHNVDLHVMLPGYTSSRVEDHGEPAVERARGFGDVVLRSKANVWGNDGGPTALGVMPFVKLPTNEDGLGNNSVEGGLIVPLAVELPRGWDMGLMAEVDVVRNRFDGGYHPEFVQTVAFGHDIVGRLGGYVEFFSQVSAERGGVWIGTVGLGLTYAISGDLQLDAGVNVGVTRAGEDINPFLGVSYRF